MPARRPLSVHRVLNWRMHARKPTGLRAVTTPSTAAAQGPAVDVRRNQRCLCQRLPKTGHISRGNVTSIHTSSTAPPGADRRRSGEEGTPTQDPELRDLCAQRGEQLGAGSGRAVAGTRPTTSHVSWQELQADRPKPPDPPKRENPHRSVKIYNKLFISQKNAVQLGT